MTTNPKIMRRPGNKNNGSGNQGCGSGRSASNSTVVESTGKSTSPGYARSAAVNHVVVSAASSSLCLVSFIHRPKKDRLSYAPLRDRHWTTSGQDLTTRSKQEQMQAMLGRCRFGRDSHPSSRRSAKGRASAASADR